MASLNAHKSASSARDQPTALKELFSYRLNRLAYVSSRIAAGLNESRAAPDMSLNAVAREANIDKSQASRTVSELIERGLICRSADSQDGRGVSLDLTRTGRALYEEMFPAAVQRNEAMLSVLSPAERDEMERMLDKLTAHALEMLNEFKAEVPARRGRGVQPR